VDSKIILSLKTKMSLHNYQPSLMEYKKFRRQR